MMDKEEDAVSVVELADEFGRTAKLLGTRLTNRLSQHGLSMPRAQLLVALLRHGPQRVSRLGDHLGITQGTASTLSEALVGDDLLQRRTDPHDGRATQLALTEAGEQRAQVWLRDYEVAAREVFAALPPEQRPALMAALRILSAAKP